MSIERVQGGWWVSGTGRVIPNKAKAEAEDRASSPKPRKRTKGEE